MRERYKDMLYGVAAGFLILLVSGGGYKAYTIYQNYWTLWGWANGTQNWVNETDAKVKELDATLKALTKNANLKSMLLQQNRLDKIEARLDKLDSPPQTEAEKTKPEGEGE